jgi:two-component system, LytTR family, sensor kinase
MNFRAFEAFAGGFERADRDGFAAEVGFGRFGDFRIWSFRFWIEVLEFDSAFIVVLVFYKIQGRRASYFLLLWMTIGLFFGTKRIIETHVYGYSYPWDRALWWQLWEWALWGLLSLIIFAVCRVCERRSLGWRKQALVHALAGSAVALTQGFLAALGSHIEAWWRGWPPMQNGKPWSFLMIEKVTVVNHFHQNLLIYVAIVAAWNAVRHYKRARERELRAAELEAQLAHAQLEALRAQLHPHFLFNTLNTVAELIHHEPCKAEEMILQLSELLRLALQSQATQEVPLAEEIAFARRYLEIEQTRLGERLTVEWFIADETLSARVPNLILQPLVENAIRHGIAPFTGRGRVAIRASRHDGRLTLQVCDTGCSPDANASAPGGHGIGLANTRARLQRFYGDKHFFALTHGNGTVAELTIPFAIEAG